MRGASTGSDRLTGVLYVLYAFYAELSVVCGIKENGGKPERMENMEAKNLPNGRTLTMNDMLEIDWLIC